MESKIVNAGKIFRWFIAPGFEMEILSFKTLQIFERGFVKILEYFCV